MLLLFENPGGFMLFKVLKDDGKFTKAEVITLSLCIVFDFYVLMGFVCELVLKLKERKREGSSNLVACLVCFGVFENRVGSFV